MRPGLDRTVTICPRCHLEIPAAEHDCDCTPTPPRPAEAERRTVTVYSENLRVNQDRTASHRGAATP